MKKTIAIYILFICALLNVHAQESKDNGRRARAREAAARGAALINEGRYDEALRSLDSAVSLHPSEPDYRYERALVFYSKREFDKAIGILQPLTGERRAREQYWQLLASAYTMKDSLIAAQTVLEKAQEKFPKSGAIFNELGRNALRQQNHEQAITYWEFGMRNAPRYAMNYYDAAKFLSRSPNRIWAIIYGEIFINLEPGTKRCGEMSTLVADMYKKSLLFRGDSSYANFCMPPVLSSAGRYDEHPPFEVGLLKAMNNAFKSIAMLNDTSLSISSLHTLRRDFINGWYTGGEQKFYPNPLFAWHKELHDNNFFESYNYWLLNKERPEEFKAWYEGNKERFRDFLAWFQKNPIRLDEKNVVSRPE